MNGLITKLAACYPQLLAKDVEFAVNVILCLLSQPLTVLRRSISVIGCCGDS